MENEVAKETITESQSTLGQMEALRGIMSDAEIQSMVQQGQPETTQTAQDTQTATPEVKREAATTPAPEVKPVNADIEALKNSTFFQDVVTTPTAPVEIKEWVDAAKHISENTGIEVKELNDLPKVIQEYKTYKEQVALLPDLQNQVKQFTNIFQSIPDDVFEILDLALTPQKGDYRLRMKEMSSDKIDISVPFEKQDKKTILDFFYPGKFSAEDYEDSENEKVQFAYEEAEKKFAEHSKSVNANRVNYRKSLEEKEFQKAEMLKSSAIESFTALTKATPIPETSKNNIAKFMEGGVQSVMNFLFTDEGKWKPDAAEKINILLHAKQDLEIAKKVIKNQTLSSVNEEIVTRMHDNPNIQGTGAATASKLTPEQEAEMIVNKMLNR